MKRRVFAALALFMAGSFAFAGPPPSAAGTAKDAQVEAAGSNCFARHLTQALTINRYRTALYADATGGASRPISAALIRSEELALATNWAVGFDRRARVYQDAGIPVFCEEFIDMSFAPDFRIDRQNVPLLANYKKPESLHLRFALLTALTTNGFSGIASTAAEEALKLASEPRFNCLTRHVLDSVIRVATVAQDHEIAVAQTGLPSPADLVNEFLLSHLLTINEAIDLDELAAPLQANGVPILCRDVPPIPARGQPTQAEPDQRPSTR